MYSVLMCFTDGENGKAWPLDKGGLLYAVGDTYPKEGFEPSEEHIAYLLGSGNKLGKPVIERVCVIDDVNQGNAKGPSKMTKEELLAFAAERDIPLGEAKSKAEILVMIEEALRE